VLLLTSYSGTWLVLQDIRKLLERDIPHESSQELRTAVRRIRLRRNISLVFCGVLVLLWFSGGQLKLVMLVVVVLHWISTASQASEARKLVNAVSGRLS
jgi:hypothetical protein